MRKVVQVDNCASSLFRGVSKLLLNIYRNCWGSHSVCLLVCPCVIIKVNCTYTFYTHKQHLECSENYSAIIAALCDDICEFFLVFATIRIHIHIRIRIRN